VPELLVVYPFPEGMVNDLYNVGFKERVKILKEREKAREGKP